MTDKFYKLIIAYNQQYPNKEVTMWLLYSYGTEEAIKTIQNRDCLLYTSPSPRDKTVSRMPSSA